MITTLYGQIAENNLKKFCEIAGHKYKNGEWAILSDEVEYWQLTAPQSMVEETKWKKKKGWLSIRDLNFQYACFKCPKFTTGLNKNEKVKTFDIEKAIQYAEDNLFDFSGQPIYLPDELEKEICNKTGKTYNPDKKPKSYNKILQEEEERFKQLNEKND